MKKSIVLFITALFSANVCAGDLPGDGWDAETNTLYLNSNANANAYKDNAIIQHVVVHADVTAIGDAAFQNCSNLATVIVKPVSCALGTGVFDGCTQLSAIYVPVVAVDAYRNATNWETYRLKIFGKVVWDMRTTSFALDESQESFSQDGVTLTANTEYSYAQTVDNTCNLVYDYNSATSDTAFTFSIELGKFTKIALIGVGAYNLTASGWSMQGDTAIWINNDGSNSVYFGTAVEDVNSIEFTISGITVPGWLQPGDLWNNDTKTLYVNSNPVANAYAENIEIRHVVVDAGVTSIGERGFRRCTALESVTCMATTPPALGANVFDSVNVSSIPLYVPESSVSAYKAAAQWQDFYIQDPTPTNIDNANANANAVKIFRDGQLYIIRDGKMYNVTGQEVK